MLIIQRPSVEPLGEEEDGHQRFAFGPLEPGFGHTVGNSLRRVLLSSIPGAAVTSVRFDDVVHEYTTVDGVKEDVIDILLNVKDIVVRSHSEEPQVLRLDVRGPAEVTAKDLQLTAEVEVLNPDLHIATVNSKGRLGMDLTVEQGKGYSTPEQNKTGGPVGVIPVDSIYSPVQRVAFSVEPVRVEQSTDYDQLILDITTDGSMTPRAALASAAETLRSLLSVLVGLEEEPVGLEMGEAQPAPGGDAVDLTLAIEDLGLSERPRNCLKRVQINTIGELIERTEEELMAITNFGQKSLDEVLEKLDERGLSLRRR